MNHRLKLLNNSFVFLPVALAACFFIGKSITVVPTNFPLALIFGAAIVLLGFFYTHYAIIILILAMLLSPEFTIASFPQRDVVVRIEDILLAIFFFVWVTKMAFVKGKSLFAKTPLNGAIFFYSSVFILVTLRGMMLDYVKPLLGLFYILKYLEYFLIYFFTCSVISSQKQMKTYVKALIFTFVIVVLYATTQIGIGRVSAPFEGSSGEPNTLGGYLVLLQGLILGVAAHSNTNRKKIILVSLFLLSLLPFAFTFSRASYMSFLPMYLVLLFHNRTRNKNMFIGALIIATIFLIYFFPQNVKERLAHTFTPEDTIDAPAQEILGIKFGPSSSARIYNWKFMIDQWKYSPLFGYGITGRGFIDGQYIRILTEMGALGLTAFLIMVITLGRQSLRIYRSTKDEFYKGVSIGFLAGHMGMMVHCISTNTFVVLRIMEPYWFIAALVMSIPMLEKKEQEEIEIQAKIIEENKEPEIKHPPLDKKKLLANSHFLLQNGNGVSTH